MIDGNIAYLSPIACSLYAVTEKGERRQITHCIMSSLKVHLLKRDKERVTAWKRETYCQCNSFPFCRYDVKYTK